jgi:hypothetical protein
MTKHQLHVEYDYDFVLIGISCHAKDYRLCWALNNNLHLELEKEEKDLEIFNKKQEESSRYSVYEYFHEENHTEYTLISNRSSNGYLVPEQKQADYFLIIKNNFEGDPLDFVAGIKKIDFVLTAYPIEAEGLKSKQNLLL